MEAAMDIDEVRNELERLCWGLTRTYDATLGPAGIEAVSVPDALSRALVVVYRYDIEQVRAVLDRIEASPNPTSVIRNESARLDKLEAGVDSMVAKMDAMDRRYQ